MKIIDNYAAKKGCAIKLINDNYSHLGLVSGDYGFVEENFIRHYNCVLVNFCNPFNNYNGSSLVEVNVLDYCVLPDYKSYVRALLKNQKKAKLNTTFLINNTIVTSEDLINHRLFKIKNNKTNNK